MVGRSSSRHEVLLLPHTVQHHLPGQDYDDGDQVMVIRVIRFSSSPTPSSITFLVRMMVIRWWWWGRPSPSRSLSTIQRAQRKAYFNFWDENSLLSISCFKTRMRICSFNLRLQDENKNRNSDNSRDNGDAVGYCGHDDVKMLCNIDPHKYLTFGVKNKKGFGECISAGCLVWFPHTPSVTIFSGWVFGPNNRCLIYATQLMCGNNLFQVFWHRVEQHGDTNSKEWWQMFFFLGFL